MPLYFTPRGTSLEMCVHINQQVLADFVVDLILIISICIFGPPPDSKYLIYMGKDKYENEELIRYGLPEDIW
jgi:hypothetical protein